MTYSPRHIAPLGAALTAALTAALVAGIAAPSAEARQASRDTSAMILGPLRAELDAPRPTAPAAVDLPAAAPGLSLRYFDNAVRFVEPLDSPAPAAASLAGAVLSVRTPDPATRYGLSAFSGRSAVLARTPAGSQLSVSFSEAPSGVARLAFDPASAQSAGRALDPTFSARHRNMAVNYEAFFDAPGRDGGLDVGVSPRAGVALGDDGTAARAGATVRLGQYLGELENDRPAWWFFAGADRQAVLYDPGQGFDVRGALAMQPYAMVGDAQAGVAVRVGSADVSLAYVRRETRYALPQQDWETSEGFAAFSLTWKR